MPINPFHEGATARVAPASIDDLEAGVTLNTTYDDAWGADAPKPREPQSDDEVVRVPHLELRALPEPAPSTSRSKISLMVQPAPLITMEPAPNKACLLYTSPSPRDATLSRMPSSA